MWKGVGISESFTERVEGAGAGEKSGGGVPTVRACPVCFGGESRIELAQKPIRFIGHILHEGLPVTCALHTSSCIGLARSACSPRRGLARHGLLELVVRVPAGQRVLSEAARGGERALVQVEPGDRRYKGGPPPRLAERPGQRAGAGASGGRGQERSAGPRPPAEAARGAVGFAGTDIVRHQGNARALPLSLLASFLYLSTSPFL